VNSITAVIEGMADEGAVRSIARAAGFTVSEIYGRKGKEFIRSRITKFNAAARFSPWLVLVDLDATTSCPGNIRRNWIPQQEPGLVLRVAVRELEAWLGEHRRTIACASHSGGVGPASRKRAKHRA
jgi:hypothetical protein